jgi:hypothetical protein
MKRKGQAAMEFLMTYGWAILVVLAAIAALAYFGVLSPGNLVPERTTFTAPLPNVDSADITDSLDIAIAFMNNAGHTIDIMATRTGPCAATGPIQTGISNGDPFVVVWNCATQLGLDEGDRFKYELGFEYNNTGTTQVRIHRGTVEARAPRAP